MSRNNDEDENGQEKLPKIKLPKGTPGSYADLLYSTRQQRYQLQHAVNKLKAMENALQDWFVNNLSKDSTGVAGRVARVQIEPASKPVVEDWPKFYAHLLKTKSFDLLQRRINEKAAQARWEQGKQVPGVGKFNVKKVSCTAIKKGK